MIELKGEEYFIKFHLNKWTEQKISRAFEYYEILRRRDENVKNTIPVMTPQGSMMDIDVTVLAKYRYSLFMEAIDRVEILQEMLIECNAGNLKEKRFDKATIPQVGSILSPAKKGE